MQKNKKNSALRIAVTGPESTGKSYLAGALSHHFKGSFVPEFARKFLESHPDQYSYTDILYMAKQQWKEIAFAQEQQGDGFLFCDTEMTVLRIWCEYKYGQCHDWIINKQQSQDFDLYLLMDIDLPWQPDPLREHPDKRKELLDLYIAALESQNWPWVLVSGIGKSRFERAIRIIEERL